MQLLLRLMQAIIFGAIAFTFTRFLVALGVPLDEWGTRAGRAMNVHFDTLLWGSVLVLTVVLFWADGKYSVFERLFYAVRPVKLSDEAMLRFTALAERAQTLIAQGVRVDVATRYAA